MNTPAPTPPRDDSLFFVASLNSFNRFAKGAKAAARRHFDVMNEEPKVPCLFTGLKAAARPGKLQTPVKKEAKAPVAIVKPLRKVVPEKKPTPKAAIPPPTPPSEKVVRRDTKPPSKIPVRTVAALKKVQAPPKPIAVAPKKAQTPPKLAEVAPRMVQTARKPVNSTKPRSASPKAARSSQLATPPPTPPLVPIVQRTVSKSIVTRTPTRVGTGKPAVGIPSPSPRVRTTVSRGTPNGPKLVVKKSVEPSSAPVVVKTEVTVPTAEADIVPSEKAPAGIASDQPSVEVPSLEKEDSIEVPAEINLSSSRPKEEELSFARRRALAMVQLKDVFKRRAEIALALAVPRKETIEEPIDEAQASSVLKVSTETSLPRPRPEEESSFSKRRALAMHQLKDVLRRRVEMALAPVTPDKDAIEEQTVAEAPALSVPESSTELSLPCPPSEEELSFSQRRALAMDQLKEVFKRRAEIALAPEAPRKETPKEPIVDEASAPSTPKASPETNPSNPPPEKEEESSFFKRRAVVMDQLKDIFGRRAEVSLAPTTLGKDAVEEPMVGKAPACSNLEMSTETNLPSQPPEEEGLSFSRRRSLALDELKDVLKRRGETVLASAEPHKRNPRVDEAPVPSTPGASAETSLPSPPPEEASFSKQCSLAMDELKNVLKRRAETALAPATPRKDVAKGLMVDEAPAPSTFDLKVTGTEDIAAAAMSTKNDVVRDGSKPASGAIANGIQARMHALFGNASGSCGPTKGAPGAYVRRLKIPELDKGNMASQNKKIQSEVEALRTMGRVGSGSHAIVKTKAFGGSMAANYAAGEGRTTAPSLEWMAIMARRKREQAETS